MNKMLIIGAMCAAASFVTGCASFEGEWGGETIVTDKDGAPVVINGQVQKAKQPNKVVSKRFGVDTKIDSGSMSVNKEGYNVVWNGYETKVSPENKEMIKTSGEAIAEITGRAISAALTSGISEVSRRAIPAFQAIASQYLASGGSIFPAVTVQRDAQGRIAYVHISDGRVTQTGQVDVGAANDAEKNPSATNGNTNATASAGSPQ